MKNFPSKNKFLQKMKFASCIDQSSQSYERVPSEEVPIDVKKSFLSVSVKLENQEQGTQGNCCYCSDRLSTLNDQITNILLLNFLENEGVKIGKRQIKKFWILQQNCQKYYLIQFNDQSYIFIPRNKMVKQNLRKMVEYIQVKIWDR